MESLHPTPKMKVTQLYYTLSPRCCYLIVVRFYCYCCCLLQLTIANFTSIFFLSVELLWSCYYAHTSTNFAMSPYIVRLDPCTSWVINPTVASKSWDVLPMLELSIFYHISVTLSNSKEKGKCPSLLINVVIIWSSSRRSSTMSKCCTLNLLVHLYSWPPCHVVVLTHVLN